MIIVVIILLLFLINLISSIHLYPNNDHIIHKIGNITTPICPKNNDMSYQSFRVQEGSLFGHYMEFTESTGCFSGAVHYEYLQSTITVEAIIDNDHSDNYDVEFDFINPIKNINYKSNEYIYPLCSKIDIELIEISYIYNITNSLPSSYPVTYKTIPDNILPFFNINDGSFGNSSQIYCFNSTFSQDINIIANNDASNVNTTIKLTIVDQPPETITYNKEEYLWYQYTNVNTNVPTITGGNKHLEYSIKNNTELSNILYQYNLSIDKNTGEISGIPKQSLNTFEPLNIYVSNLGGSTSTTIFIQIKCSPITNFVISTNEINVPVYYDLINDNVTASYNVEHNCNIDPIYTVTPTLPSNIYINTQGQLLGYFNEPYDTTIHTIMIENDNNNSTFEISLTSYDEIPINTTFESINPTYTKDVLIENNELLCKQRIKECNNDVDYPPGLTFDNNLLALTGTPTKIGNYTLQMTCKNSKGSIKVALAITIVDHGYCDDTICKDDGTLNDLCIIEHQNLIYNEAFICNANIIKLINTTITMNKDSCYHKKCKSNCIENCQLSINANQFFMEQSSIIITPYITINVNNLINIDTNSLINTSTQGYELAESHWLSKDSSSSGINGIGAGHGGNGGINNCHRINAHMGNSHDIFRNPSHYGSPSYSKKVGEDVTLGGGIINLIAGKLIVINGKLLANGQSYIENKTAGAAGGTITLSAKNITLSTSSSIEALGGNGNYLQNLAAGGGGIIAIYKLQQIYANNLSLFLSHIHVNGGDLICNNNEYCTNACFNYYGGNGIIYYQYQSDEVVYIKASPTLKHNNNKQSGITYVKFIDDDYNKLTQIRISYSNIYFENTQDFIFKKSNLYINNYSNISLSDYNIIEMNDIIFDSNSMLYHNNQLIINANSLQISHNSTFKIHILQLDIKNDVIISDFSTIIPYKTLSNKLSYIKRHQLIVNNINEFKCIKNSALTSDYISITSTSIDLFSCIITSGTIGHGGLYKDCSAPLLNNNESIDKLDINSGLNMLINSNKLLLDYKSILYIGAIYIDSNIAEINGTIDTSGRGCKAENGYGAGNRLITSMYGSGAGHYRAGGASNSLIHSNMGGLAYIYDLNNNPDSSLGSGGGGNLAGNGGGLIKLAIDQLLINSNTQLSVKGSNANKDSGSGGGSAGSIIIYVNKLTIDTWESIETKSRILPNINLNGGNADSNLYGGGGSSGSFYWKFKNIDLMPIEHLINVDISPGLGTNIGGYGIFQVEPECNNQNKGIFCDLCNAGQYKTHSGICQNCEPGTFSSDDINFCQACLAGSYAIKYGSDTCNLCPLGTMSSQTGAKQCQSCNAGEYNNIEGQTSCTLCDSGYYMDEIGASSCHKCEIGYGSTVGSSSCNICTNHVPEQGYYTFNCKIKCKIGFVKPDCLTPFNNILRIIGSFTFLLILFISIFLFILCPIIIGRMKAYNKQNNRIDLLSFDHHPKTRRMRSTSIYHHDFIDKILSCLKSKNNQTNEYEALHHTTTHDSNNLIESFNIRLQHLKIPMIDTNDKTYKKISCIMNDNDLNCHIFRIYLLGNNDVKSSLYFHSSINTSFIHDIINHEEYQLYIKKANKILKWYKWEELMIMILYFICPLIAYYFANYRKRIHLIKMINYQELYQDDFIADYHTRMIGEAIQFSASQCLTTAWIDLFDVSHTINKQLNLKIPHIPALLLCNGNGNYLTPFYLDINDPLIQSYAIYYGIGWFKFLNKVNILLRTIRRTQLITVKYKNLCQLSFSKSYCNPNIQKLLAYTEQINQIGFGTQGLKPLMKRLTFTFIFLHQDLLTNHIATPRIALTITTKPLQTSSSSVDALRINTNSPILINQELESKQIPITSLTDLNNDNFIEEHIENHRRDSFIDLSDENLSLAERALGKTMVANISAYSTTTTTTTTMVHNDTTFSSLTKRNISTDSSSSSMLNNTAKNTTTNSSSSSLNQAQPPQASSQASSKIDSLIPSDKYYTLKDLEENNEQCIIYDEFSSYFTDLLGENIFIKTSTYLNRFTISLLICILSTCWMIIFMYYCMYLYEEDLTFLLSFVVSIL